MFLANSQNNFSYTLKVNRYMRKKLKLDIAINFVRYWFFFVVVVVVVSTYKECKTFYFSVFVGILFAIAFKRRKLDYG